MLGLIEGDNKSSRSAISEGLSLSHEGTHNAFIDIYNEYLLDE